MQREWSSAEAKRLAELLGILAINRHDHYGPEDQVYRIADAAATLIDLADELLREKGANDESE